jgi:hypothetical protein
MTMLVNDWFLTRIYGSPNCDGYGSQVLNVDNVVQNVNLGRNSMYKLQPKMDADSMDVDGYFAVLDAWNDDTVQVGTLNDAPVTDAKGMILRHEQDIIITTNSRRHVLSVKMPDGGIATMSLRVIRLEPGKCKDEKTI